MEEKGNGWSKIEYEGREAYIKSEFLEPSETTEASAGNGAPNTSQKQSGISQGSGTLGNSTHGNGGTGGPSLLGNNNPLSQTDIKTPPYLRNKIHLGD